MNAKQEMALAIIRSGKVRPNPVGALVIALADERAALRAEVERLNASIAKHVADADHQFKRAARAAANEAAALRSLDALRAKLAPLVERARAAIERHRAWGEWSGPFNALIHDLAHLLDETNGGAA